MIDWGAPIAELGRGTFGLVRSYLINGVIRAVKTEISPSTTDFNQSLVQEAAHLRLTNHPRFVKLLELGVNNNHLYLVMEAMETNVFRILRALRTPSYSPEKWATEGYLPIEQVIVQIISAVAHLHSQQITHRDLKPQNLLYSASEGIKLADFGAAVSFLSFRDQLDFEVTTLEYRAPEVVREQPYDHRVDCWGLGCLIVELITGYALFDRNADWNRGLWDMDLNPKVNLLLLIDLQIPRLNQLVKSLYLGLIEKLLVVDFHQRITVQEALNSLVSPRAMKGFRMSSPLEMFAQRTITHLPVTQPDRYPVILRSLIFLHQVAQFLKLFNESYFYAVDRFYQYLHLTDDFDQLALTAVYVAGLVCEHLSLNFEHFIFDREVNKVLITELVSKILTISQGNLVIPSPWTLLYNNYPSLNLLKNYLVIISLTTSYPSLTLYQRATLAYLIASRVEKVPFEPLASERIGEPPFELKIFDRFIEDLNYLINQGFSEIAEIGLINLKNLLE